MNFPLPHPLPEQAISDELDLVFEAAVEQEWQILRDGLDPDIESGVMAAFADLQAEAAIVEPASGDSVGRRLATSRFDAVEAVLQAWAADGFQQVFNGPAPVASLVPSAADNTARYSEAIELARHSLEGSSRAEPHALLAARVVLGRVYNRLFQPPRPFEWVGLITQSDRSTGGVHLSRDVSRIESLFKAACDAVAPGAADELIRIARNTVTQEMQAGSMFPGGGDGDRDAGTSAPDSGPGSVSTRQLIGRSVSSGSVSGTVHLPGNPVPMQPYVLVCDRLTPDLAGSPDFQAAGALVERFGSAFGLGSIASLERGLPHVYAVAQARLLSQNEPVTVNANTRLVISHLTA